MKKVVELEACCDCPNNTYRAFGEKLVGRVPYMTGAYFCRLTGKKLKCCSRGFPESCPLSTATGPSSAGDIPSQALDSDDDNSS